MQNAEKINLKRQEGQSLIKGLRGIAEHLAAFAAVSLLSLLAAKLGGRYFDKSGDMILWVAIIIGVASIGHALFVSLHYLFPHGINIQRKLAPHIAIFLLLLFLLMATSSVTLLTLNKEEVNNDPKPKISAVFFQLSVLESKVSNSGKLESRYIQDALAAVTKLIQMNKSFKSIRSTLVYLDTSKQFLVMPQNGYYGEGFDSELPQKLYFDVRNKADHETDMAYRIRLGFAGCAFKNEKELIDNDVQHQLPNEPCVFKDEQATQKLERDFAMICMPIYKKTDSKREIIGILSVSSTEKAEFTEDEVEIVRYVANLLSKSDMPIETPEWLMEKKNENIKLIPVK